jgi:DNA-binding NtrC family response regulator
MVTTRPLIVLIVDDEPSVGFISQMKFRRSIQDGSVELHFFESGKDCLDYLDTVDDDADDMVIFSDINMPEISGYDLLESVHNNHPLIPVYMLSAYDDAASVNKATRLGAKGYFTKPIDFDKLKAALQNRFGLLL